MYPEWGLFRGSVQSSFPRYIFIWGFSCRLQSNDIMLQIGCKNWYENATIFYEVGLEEDLQKCEITAPFSLLLFFGFEK